MVSIVIAAYNVEQTIDDCLKSIFESDFPESSFEVIVVDNNSVDKTAELVKEYDVRFLEENNQGPSFARNTGLSHASGEIVVFLDADTIVKKDWLKNLTAPFDDKTIGAVGGKILPIKNKIISHYFGHSFFGQYPMHRDRQFEKSMPSCSLAVRKELVENGFDINLPIYTEDLDLTMRISQSGLKILYEPDAVVYHHHPESFQQLWRYWKKSSVSRTGFCSKYPKQKACILLKFQVIPIHFILSIWALKIWGSQGGIVFLPMLFFLYKKTFNEYKKDRNFVLNFVVVPALDYLSFLVTSVLFGYHRLIMKG